MKKSLFLLLFTLLFLQIGAQERQIPYPRLSPLQKIETTVGIVDFTLVYFRPSMRGRKIFGDLVPYNEIWRTGANKNTKIVFDDNVMIGENELMAGTYTIFTKPSVDKWEIYFHVELDEYGAPEKLDPKNIKAKIIVPAISLDQTVETFSITFNNLKLNSADLVIAWENTYVPIPIKIPTSKIIHDRILKEREVLASDYRAAAFILFEKQKLNQQALDAINQAILITANGKSFEEWFENADYSNRHLPNNYRIKSEIFAALGEQKKAIKAAEISLRIANKVNSDFYIKENLNNLKNWNK